jgi:integrase
MGRSKADIKAEMERLATELAASEDVGIYEDGSGRWYIRLNVNGSWTTRRTAPDGSPLLTRDQAVEAKGAWAVMVERSEVAIGRDRFDAYWAHYLKARKGTMTPGSWEDLSAHGKLRLVPHFGGTLLSRIDVPAVRDWRSVMYELVEAGEISAKTVNNSRVALRGCFKMAVADRKMNFNPVADVEPLDVTRVERPFIKIARIGDYLDCCADYYEPLARFLVATGSRVSEAIAVRVEDLNFDELSVAIVRQRERDGADTVPTKGKAFRRVYFGPQLALVLRRLIAERLTAGVEDDGWLFVVRPPKRGRYSGRGEWTPPHRKTVHDWHEDTLKAAGLPDMPLHSLRHTAAAAWLTTGNRLEFVKRQLGHSTISTTSDYYGHMEDELRATGAADTEARIIAARQLGVVSS